MSINTQQLSYSHSLVYTVLYSSLLAVIVLPILVYFKSEALGGMLNIRLMQLFYYFLFLWIAAYSIKNKVITFISIFLISFSFINLCEIRHLPLSIASKSFQNIIKASEFVKTKSIVYPIYLIDPNVVYYHFSNLLGINKEIVITENYEAELGWFPLKWKRTVKPVRCELHNKNIQLPDYLFIIGNNFRVLNPADSTNLKIFIDSVCTNIYNTEDGFTHLYYVNKSKAE